MADTTPISEQLVVELRRAHGSATGPELQQLLKISQPTFSRAVAPLIQSGHVRRVGAGRNQLYLLPRTVAGIGETITIMRVDAAGVVMPFATVIPVFNGRFWVKEAAGPARIHDGLPWFMSDMRPQGFIGKTFSQAHPELNLARNPEHWSDDDVLKALSVTGEDLMGNLIVGAGSLERYHSLPGRLTRVASELEYPALANQAMQGTPPGSSAGGEQPKFGAVIDGRHVLVKFSPAGESAVDQRARDLLVCEHLALKTLNDAGIAAARSRALFGENRVFLEVERFDRTATGRIGMVSLMAYDAEYVGQMDNWAATAGRMAQRKLLKAHDAELLQFLEAFGRLIGNTDRHYGNISLLIEGDDWVLSPTYDVLPMVYAPTAGELVERDFSPAGVKPTADTLGVWERAQALAADYWRAVSTDERISEGFRKLIVGHADTIQPAP